MKRRLSKGLVQAIALLTVMLTTLSSYGRIKMIALYDLIHVKSIKPQIFTVNTTSSISLFPVPYNGSIGTNDLNNAITLMSFDNYHMSMNQYFKNVFDQVGGGGEFLPVFSQDTIGFGQSRRFVFYNFKTRHCERYRIVGSIEGSIEKIAIVDGAKRQFLVELKHYNPKSEDYNDYETVLVLVDLSGKEVKVIREIKIDNGVTWSVELQKLFLYDIEKNNLWTLTLKFQPTQHPLIDIVNKNKKTLDFTRVYIHPILPFAILGAGTQHEVIVSWKEGINVTPITIFGNTVSAHDFSFSPDGKWLAFTEGGVMDHLKTYLMPVSQRYPHYLGFPILLWDHHFNENYYAWTTNPISFVGSSENKIYRWELTNAAHPESDRATFHDYIVDHDLERLAREKRQGMGEKQR